MAKKTKRKGLAWTVLAFCVINWPLSIFTYAKSEPPIVLSLSWAAMVLTAVLIVIEV